MPVHWISAAAMVTENIDNRRWHEYINHKVRSTYLSVLRHLSERGVPTVVVGSAALLARGYYQKNYWWDVDLLFRDVASLDEFNAGIAAAENFAIERVDRELQESPELISLHTLWSYKRG